MRPAQVRITSQSSHALEVYALGAPEPMSSTWTGGSSAGFIRRSRNARPALASWSEVSRAEGIR
jgi:hypothetical protein